MKKRRIKHFKSNKGLVAAELALLATASGLAYGGAGSVKADAVDAGKPAATVVAAKSDSQPADNANAAAANPADSTKTADAANANAADATTANTANANAASPKPSASPKAAAKTTATANAKAASDAKTATKAVQAAKVPDVQTASKAVTAAKTTTTTSNPKNAFGTTAGSTYYYDANGQAVKSQVFTVSGKQYYADAKGQIAKNTTKTLNGIKVSFDKKGAVNNKVDYAQLLRDQVEFLTAVDLKKNVKYDWTEAKNGYQESAVHEMAQLLAQKDVNDDDAVISSLMEKNSSMPGKVLTTLTMNVGQNGYTASQFSKALIAKLGSADATSSVVGAGYYNGTLAALIYQAASQAKAKQAASAISADVVKAYNSTTVAKGLTDGSKMPAADLAKLVSGVSSSLLTGPEGTAISDQVLTTIEAGLAGDAKDLTGVSNYYDDKGTAYHYEYWLDGADSAAKLANFLALNRGVKYGQSLKVNYSATLTKGEEAAVEPVNETPASKKSKDELDLAYQTGTETGLKYEPVTVQKIAGMTKDTIRGVDISTYQALINAGVKFYDFNGKEASLIKVLADAGVNWIRLRVWNNPYNAAGQGYGGGNTDEESLIKMAKEAKQYGMKLLVDFHYSDFWADPAKQPLPKAWKNLSVNALNESISLYTKKVLRDLARAGGSADMVQVGNEVTNGVFGLYTDRDHNGTWQSLWLSVSGDQAAKYLATAAKAVRDAAPLAKIAVQLETPNIDKYRTIMTVLKKNGVDYDYLGTSYYPFWSTGNGNGTYKGKDLGTGANTPDNLLAVEQMAKEEFGKPTVVLETGWLNVDSEDGDGEGNSVNSVPNGVKYAASPQGQVDEMTDMYKAIVAGGGLGAFYWEPAQIPVKAGNENWNYNDQMSNAMGTGWAAKYAIGYAPDSVMFYNGKETWGGSTWDNVALFDDKGYPLQSLMMYKGFLDGYKTAFENTASAADVKLSAVYGTDGASVKAENVLKAGQSVTLPNYLTSAAAEYLNGVKGTEIPSASLKAVFNGLDGNADAIKGASFTGTDGSKYHYEYWLEGQTAAEKLANFLKANAGVKYGDPVKINYTATLIKEDPKEVSVTSTVTPALTKVWGLDGVTIDKPLTAGAALLAEDAKSIQALVASYLTGTKGTAISSSTWDKIKTAFNTGVNGNTVYTVAFTSNKSTYRYVYYLDGTDLESLNKDAKYGDPIKLNVSASLKWIGNI